jgi:spermidine synthase
VVLVVGALAALAAPAVAAPSSEHVIVELPSPYGAVRVVDRPGTGLRCLSFPPSEVLQTCMRRAAPAELELRYARSMAAAVALPARTPRRVLLLGLGGGALPRFLHAALPGLRQDAVEINPVVVRVCREHFGLPPGDAVAVHVADARAWLEAAPGPWDVILLDAYAPDEVPEHLATREFFALVRQRLAPGGVAVANLWERRLNAAYPRQVATILAELPHAVALTSGAPRDPSGNVVVAAAAAALPPMGEWAARATALGRPVGDDLGALVALEAAPLAAQAGAEPLHDRPKARAAGQ